MGSSYGISCTECDYSKSFTIGIGMRYSRQNLMDFESQFALLPNLISSKEVLTQIIELINEKGGIITDDYGHEIYRCPKCGEFYERFFLHLDYDNGSFEIEYKCPKCKTNLQKIHEKVENGNRYIKKEINLKKYPCPQCGKHSLCEDDSRMILWD